jgi:hypothetical protein
MALRSTSPLDGSTLSVFKEWNGYKLREALDQVEGHWPNAPSAWPRSRACCAATLMNCRG